MVATDMSAAGFERDDFDRSFALDMRMGTSDLSEELI
jgi:hypothetical protein